MAKEAASAAAQQRLFSLFSRSIFTNHTTRTAFFGKMPVADPPTCATVVSSLTHEHRKTALGQGFARDRRGITRKRAGTGWAYYAPNGVRIRDADKRKRINSLVIPPAWTEVWICPEADGHIQATARDARGRKQYRYHAQYREACDRSKFRRMLEFSEILPHLRERIERDLAAPDLTRRQILATVIRLLDRTLIRVGNDEYARENRSFGLTTLRRRHVAVEGNSLRFSFRGKSGVEHHVRLADRRLARIIQRCQDLPGTEIFQYIDGNARRQSIASDDVNAHLREIAGRQITAKDFRTWGGTMEAGRSRSPAIGSPRPDAARPSATSSAPSPQVARTPGQHTRGLPQVLRAPRRSSRPPGRGAPWSSRRGQGTNGQRRGTGAAGAAAAAEVAVLQFLHEHLEESTP